MDTIKLSFYTEAQEPLPTTTLEFKTGVTIEEVYHDFANCCTPHELIGTEHNPVVLAIYNNEVCDFQTRVMESGKLVWLRLDSREGQAAYQRSLILLLVRAVKECFPEGEVKVEHSLGNALFCELQLGNDWPITTKDVIAVEKAMQDIKVKDKVITKHLMARTEAIKHLQLSKRILDAHVLDSLKDIDSIIYYQSGNTNDYFLGPMVPDLSYLKTFSLEHYAPGLLLRYPDYAKPDELPPYRELPKFAKVFLEAKEWGRTLDCSYVAQLNDYIENGEIDEIIDLAEALQEKKRAQIADFISSQTPAIKLILIAGPSSAGKTTFTKRLCTQLRVNNMRPTMLSLDDYFVDRNKTPRLPDGSYDFESLKALDVEFFSQQVLDLYAGKEVYLPEFDFKTGKRKFREKAVRLAPNSPLVVEGLHALNDELSRVVPRYEKCKIFLCALTQLAINNHNRISTTDTRLVRRLVRDYQFRGHSAETTFAMWEGVRRGEEVNIFPFQEDADVIFNSALIYELGVLKSLALPLLEEVPKNSPYYHQATRLKRFFLPFKEIESCKVPEISLLREFIGYDK